MIQLHFRAIAPFLSKLPGAILISLSLSASAVAIGFLIGLLVVAGRRNRSSAVRWAAALYVEIMRNVPVLALLYLAYFGLPRLGIRVGGFGSAVVALSLNSGAYLAEIFRAGLLAIPSGQTDAAQSLGLTRLATFRLVLFPQMLRTIYGPVGNVLIQVLLGSSLASVVAVNDVADWMQNVGSETFRYFETFAVAALTYVILCQAVNLARLAVGRVLFSRPA